MNNGEKNELLIKLKLIQLRDSNQQINIGNNFNIINSVGFNKEYKTPSSNFKNLNLEDLSINEIENLAIECGISKAPGRSKADVYINGSGVSLKSLQNAPPAIVNHTSRSGFEVAFNHTKSEISNLDKMIEKYWELRTTNKIKEDVPNESNYSPFASEKEILKPVVNYFLFDGTGAGLSDHQAEFILDFSHPLKTESWKTYNKNDAFDLMWDNLVFSVRSKGMPNNYPNIESNRLESINKWTRLHQNKYRGTLHIRAKKQK